MKKSQVYQERREYIEGIIGKALKPFENVEAVRYAKDPDTDSEYIRLTTLTGGKIHLDITAEHESTIFQDIARMTLFSSLETGESLTMPKNYIADERQLMSIAHLFKGGVV